MNGILSVEVKKHPEFVFSKRKQGCLVHRVASVAMHWRDGNLSHTSIHTRCGQIMFSRSVQLCAIPRPEATDCGRCYGSRPTFSKHGSQQARKEAHAQLGCVMEAS